MICSAIRRTERAAAMLAVGGTLWLSPGTAQAEPGDPAVARGLFFEARKLMSEAKWDAACPKLEESERLHPAKGTEFNLADCYEHTGRVASAWALFERVGGESHDANQAEHEALARQRAEAVAPRVPALTIEVPEGAEAARIEGLVVTRDGQAVPPAEWSIATRVDPGHHEIVARAPGRPDFSASVDLVEGARQTVRVPERAPAAVPAAAAPPLRAAAPAAIEPAPPPAPRQGAPGATQRSVGLVLTGTGGVALVAGGVFAALSLSSRSTANQTCDPTTNACTSQDGVDARSRALTDGDAATVFFVASGALLAGGLVVWLAAPRAPSGVALGVASGAPCISAVGAF